MNGSKPSAHLSILALCLAAATSSCAGTKAAVPVDVVALRSNPVAAEVGLNAQAYGVPSLAERISERPGLKLAILQVAYKIEGRPEMTFTSDIFQIGGYSSWKETTTPELLVPSTLAQQCAVDLAMSLEEALVASGFDVIPYATVAETEAYATYYGDYPVGYNLENGWTVVGAYPMKVKEATNLIDYSTLNWVWPDTAALPEIKAELGEDVLFLNLQVQVGTMQGGSAGLDANVSVDVNDPDFVGYGIGGFGHAVLNLNATTGGKVDVQGFIKHEDGMWTVNWTPIYEDMERVHDSFSAGFASELKEQAYPPVN